MTATFVEVGDCWVCGGRSLSRVHTAYFDLDMFRNQYPQLTQYRGTMWFRECGRCGFVQPEQLPALPEYFDCIYDQLWPEDWIQREFDSPYKDTIFRAVLKGLARRSPPDRRLLDVGAHAGRFLRMAADAGWQPEGIELNPRTAAFAARRTGFPVHRENIDRLVLAGRSYGAVTLTDVLEHIPAPLEVLARVHAALAPGGSIAVKVPSGPAQRFKEHARARIHRGYTPRLADNLVHVNHFSPGSLRLALERSGFVNVSIEAGAPELPPAGGPGGLMSNLLRRTLFGTARVLPGGVHTPLALNLQAFASRPR